MSVPIRITLSRKKGWRMPPNTVKVDRSTKWGNPFVVSKNGTQARCVEMFCNILWVGDYVMGAPSMDEQAAYRKFVRANIATLRGKNLACWCKQGTPVTPMCF